ncbi:uncharacterized protein PSFLO_01720 [Pseudozyma flocculosa]|uniref:DUF1746 domain-containing protein n=1 Tax=Pseudozyma flocculosa TaxID=84751 RepID=A0A5C3EYP2_9BASI|nr:uncharacterized protein PSFLO_01720 [Pseudozyma flocculosa]
MYRQRRELIQSLDLLVFALLVYVWFIDGSTLWFLVKSALQVQFCNPIQMHPTWSLPFFTVFLSCFNLLIVTVHVLGGPIGAGKSRTIIIDFVGQDHQTGKLHMVLIDLFVAFVQTVLLVVAFEHGIDELRSEGEKSCLDEDQEVDALDAGEADRVERGQGWDADDEEASLFASHRIQERADEATRSAPWTTDHSSLSQPIAVVRLQPLAERIWTGDLGQRKPGDGTGEGAEGVSGSRGSDGASSTAAAANSG